MNQKISTLAELIEHASEANKLLVSNAIAMDNGEVKESQGYTREATALLAVMLKDVFVEVREVLSVPSAEEEDYDFSSLDIAKLLSKVIYNAASLIDCYVNNHPDTIRLNIEAKLAKCLNATESLVQTILLN